MQKCKIKQYKGVLARIVVLLLGILLLIGGIGVGQVVRGNAASDDLDMTSATDSNYYMHIKLKDFVTYIKYEGFNPTEHPFWKVPTEFDATIHFNFNNVQYESRSVMVTAVTRVSQKKVGTAIDGYPLTFLGDENGEAKINIRYTYYLYFKDKDLSNITITWYFNGVGYKAYSSKSSSASTSFSVPVSFSKGAKPEGWDIPGHPNFELGDNGAQDTTPIYKQDNASWWYDVYRFFKGIFKFKFSYTTFCIWTWVIIGLLAWLIVLLPLSKWLKKRFG